MKEMRRKDRQMDEAFAYSVIDKAEFGTIATVNEDGSPYAVPVSMVRLDNKIYIHSATKGNKVENILRNPKVCMSFVGDVHVPDPGPKEELEEALKDIEKFKKLADEKFTTEFESAVIFGEAVLVTDKEEKILGLRLLCEKYNPWNMPYFDAAVDSGFNITHVIRIDIDEITSKRKKYNKDGIEMKWGRIE